MDQFRNTQAAKKTSYFGKSKRYQIMQEIGAGGMGRVYKVFDTKLNRVVALKVLLSGKNANELDNKRFLREAKTLASLQHKNVIRVYDIDVFEQQYFFTMDYIDGVTLKQAAKKLKKNQIIDIMIQVISAIHYAHRQGVIHRDIKPSNILVTKNNEPIVMDFGLARAKDSTSLTQAGSMLGTLLYSSPEQISGKKVDHLTDIYALGATLYEVLSGHPIFKSQSQANLLFLVLNKPPQPMPKTIAKELQNICFCALEKDKNKRYSSASKMARDLRNFHKGATVRKTGKSKVNQKKSSLLYAGIAIFTIAIVLIVQIPANSHKKVMQNITTQTTKQLKSSKNSSEKAQKYFSMSKKDHDLYRIEKAWLNIKKAIELEKNPVYYVYGYRIFWLIAYNCFDGREKQRKQQADRELATFLQKKDYVRSLLKEKSNEAVYCLGLMYYRGIGVEKNLMLDCEKLEEAHNRGMLDATLQLINYYKSTKQYEKLQQCYEIGVKKQFAPLMIAYANHSGDRNVYLQAAQLGHREAMCKLGYFYSIDQNPDVYTSLKYYLQAVELGSHRAIRGIVEAYALYQNNSLEIPHSYQYWTQAQKDKEQELQNIKLQDLFIIK